MSGAAGIQLPLLTTALVLLLDSSGRVSVLALPGCGPIDQGVAAAAAPPEAAALAATGSTQAEAADAGQAREDTGADRLCLLLLLLLLCCCDAERFMLLLARSAASLDHAAEPLHCRTSYFCNWISTEWWCALPASTFVHRMFAQTLLWVSVTVPAGEGLMRILVLQAPRQ